MTGEQHNELGQCNQPNYRGLLRSLDYVNAIFFKKWLARKYIAS